MHASQGSIVFPISTPHGLRLHSVPLHNLSVRYHDLFGPGPSHCPGLFQVLPSPAVILAAELSAPHVGQLQPRFLHPNVTVLLTKKPQLCVHPAVCTARPNPSGRCLPLPLPVLAMMSR